MKEFKVQFITPSGRRRRTRLWASDRHAARQIIQSRKQDPILIVETGRISTGVRTYPTTLQSQEIISILDQLEMQIGADITLVDALQTLALDLPEGKNRFVVLKIQEQLSVNGRVAESFAQFPKVFPGHIVEMIHVGHETGKLEKTFGSIVANLNAADEIRGIVKKALLTPGLTFGAVCALLVFLVGVVIPAFGKMFYDLGMPLGGLTKFYLDLGDFVRGHFVLVLAILFGVPAAIVVLIKKTKSKRFFDRLWVKIPLIRDVVQFVVVARLAGNLASLYEAEIPIQKTLEICSRITGSSVYDQAVQDARQRLSTGANLSIALSETEVFPRMMTAAIRTGEKSGNITMALEKVHRYYTRRAKEKTAMALQLIEPALTVFMTLIVGSMALSMFQPIFHFIMNYKR